MLSNIPYDLKRLKGSDLDREILRWGMMAELDAINVYEQMATMTEDPDIRTILLDIAKEEKTHVGEFQALLLARDPEQLKEMEAGRLEVEKELSE